nr:MAG TPA: hypothetical protein [Caudoviricetes sp.]
MCRYRNGGRRHRFCRNKGYDLKQDAECQESNRQSDKSCRGGNRIAPDVTGLQQKAVHEPFLVSGRLLSVGTIIIAAFKNKYIRHQANNKARVGLTLRRYGVIIDCTIK